MQKFQICHPTYIFIPVSLADEAVSLYKSRADFSLPEKISPDFSGKCGIGYITSYINYIINLKQVSGTHKNINLLGSPLGRPAVRRVFSHLKQSSVQILSVMISLLRGKSLIFSYISYSYNISYYSYSISYNSYTISYVSYLLAILVILLVIFFIY